MLVITRKKGERIRVGEDIDIVVVDVGQGRVKIGIDAPETTRADRQEVHEAIIAAMDGNGETRDDPLPGSPHTNRIAEAKRAWADCVRKGTDVGISNKRYR